jgi:hypothetical protein
MIYIVKTTSTFENVYTIEAASESEARGAVMDDGTPPNFFQKHLGERIVDIETSSDTPDDISKRIRKAGYV